MIYICFTLKYMYKYINMFIYRQRDVYRVEIVLQHKNNYFNSSIPLTTKINVDTLTILLCLICIHSSDPWNY